MTRKNSGQAPPEPIKIRRPSRPSISTRSFSSPASPQTPTNFCVVRPNDMNMLTPPSSPPRKAGPPGNLDGDHESRETLRSSVDSQRAYKYTKDGIISCPFDVELITEQNGQIQMFGYGAWSTVYKGTCHAQWLAKHGTLTPQTRSAAAPPLLVAVKTPARKDAVTILRHEAWILSRLRELDDGEEHVAAFYGIIDETSSLVIEAHPLSLEDHIRSCAGIAQASKTTENMASPVLGSTAIWLDLAEKLITTLDWLHNEAGIVHGDIKPGNILLRSDRELARTENLPYQPLFIDFSSSQQLDTTEVTPNTLSAVTKEYTAPELLTSAVLKDPKSCATTASDVFSLAVTLLVAATGDPMVYTGYSAMQRQMLATQGWGVLNNVRSLSTRLPKHGVVTTVLERAVLKKDMGRISTRTWKLDVENAKRDMGSIVKL